MPTALETSETQQPAADKTAGRGFRVSHGIEALTFRRAAFASAMEGMTNGMLSLNAYVALKALGGERAGYEAELATLVTMLPSVAMLFASAYNAGGTVRRRRGYFLFAAVFGRMVFAAVPLIVLLPGLVSPFAFVGLIAFSSLICAGVPPALNQVWGANYVQASRGKRFAWISSVGMFMVMVASWLAGEFLDGSALVRGVANYQLLYPAAGVCGALALVTFYSIRVRYAAAIEVAEARDAKPLQRLGRAYVRAFRLLKRDRNFRTYEIGFFLYGVAFMMLAPAVPVLFSRYLHADYADFSRATVVTLQCTLMLVVPFVAWFAKGRRVTIVTASAYLVLIGYPAVLGVTAATGQMAFAYGAFVVYGIAMSGVHYVWNLGPVSFAKGGNPLPYTSTHTSLVGARALVGFPLSYVLMKLFPDTMWPIFIGSSVLLLIAAMIMLRLDRRMVGQGLQQFA
ncbi:MAG: hypothetical protein KDB90_03705 [Planctomycetes bacterium]|nr:hypothetical protein [Planctomycetota bacterium]